ncbi:MAG: hypothetical protein IKQ10_04170 [Oscillospiraceae bacterium]|nr:hypothetical protein [Oscillospiraceae bacterium]
MKKRLITAAAAALFALLTVFSAEARAGASRGLALWTGLLVPSLLPYFAAAGLLTKLGAIDALGRFAARRGALPGLPKGAACGIFLLGLSGGYPLGAATAAEAVRAGTLTREEAERLLFYADNTGPAFAVGAIGAGVFGSAAVGLALWGVHALTALLLSLTCREERSGRSAPVTAAPALSFSEALTSSVSAAGLAVGRIGAYVVFFSALLAVADALGFPGAAADVFAAHIGGSAAFWRALFTGALELSSGAGAMTALPMTPETLALSSFLLGWGGLCVHFQAAAVTAGTGIRLRRRLIGKLCHGLLAAAVTFSGASILFS